MARSGWGGCRRYPCETDSGRLAAEPARAPPDTHSDPAHSVVMCLDDTNVTNAQTDIRRLMDERASNFEYRLDLSNPIDHCVGEVGNLARFH